MAFYIAQAGTALKVLTTAGAVDSTLTLPSGVTIDNTKRGRFAILNQQVLMVNAPSQNLWIDPTDFTVRTFGIQPPISAPALAAGSSTGLTGAYKVRVSFTIKNEDGVLLYESPLGPASASLTLSNEDLDISEIPLSISSSVTGRRLYRTAAGGAVFFQMLDLDDNQTESVTTALADASLSLLPSDPELGNPPGTMPGTGLELITVWRDRLWAKSQALADGDKILYCDLSKFYAWASTNFLLATPKGEDVYGITGFMPRRDELIVCKRKRIMKVVGTDEGDFEVIIIAEGPTVGCISPDSCTVIRDVGYYHATNGVNVVGPEGVMSITDKVKPWFESDDYFNRALFTSSIGGHNPETDTYDLYLAAVGSSVLDRWVSYDIRRGEWTGPHQTAALTEVSARALLEDSNALLKPVMASAVGGIFDMNQSGASDNANAIAIDWILKHFVGQAPDIEHFWGQPTVHVKKQGNAAGNLAVTARVGELDAIDDTTTLSVPLSRPKTVLPRLGPGIAARLQFTHSTDAEDVELRGLELPFTEIGRRQERV